MTRPRRVSARRRAAQLFFSWGFPLGVAGACYGLGVQDWLGARTAAAAWMAGQVALAAGS